MNCQDNWCSDMTVGWPATCQMSFITKIWCQISGAQECKQILHSMSGTNGIHCDRLLAHDLGTAEQNHYYAYRPRWEWSGKYHLAS